MNAPIPEPTPAPGPVVRGPRPRWLGVMIALDLVVFAATFFVLRRDPKLLDPELSAQTNFLVLLVVFFLFFVLWAGVTWALWCGQNWARIVSLVFSIVSIASNLLPDEAPDKWLNIASTGLALVWLFLLSRRATIDWCKGTPL